MLVAILTYGDTGKVRNGSILRVRNFLPERSGLARLSLSAFEQSGALVPVGAGRRFFDQLGKLGLYPARWPIVQIQFHTIDVWLSFYEASRECFDAEGEASSSHVTNRRQRQTGRARRKHSAESGHRPNGGTPEEMRSARSLLERQRHGRPRICASRSRRNRGRR